MFPELGHLGPFTFHSFGLLIALAFAAGLSWTYWRAKAKGLTDEQGTGAPLLQLFLVLMVVGIVGARLTYIAFFPKLFFAAPLKVLFANGGLVWYGGIIAGFLGLWWFCKRQQWSTWLLLDALAPAIALGQGIGRIGCFLAGCCYGSTCSIPSAITSGTSFLQSFSVQYPVGHLTHPNWVYPTPLFESLLMLLLSAGIIGLEGRQKFSGQLGLVFMAGYAVIRFGLEYIRGDRLVAYPALDLSASQLISIGLLIVTVALWVWCSSRSNSMLQSQTLSSPSAL